MQLGKIDLPPKERVALDAVIDAWESLPGGTNYGPEQIERWLRYKMAPAINAARKSLGRKRPDEK